VGIIHTYNKSNRLRVPKLKSLGTGFTHARRYFLFFESRNPSQTSSKGNCLECLRSQKLAPNSNSNFRSDWFRLENLFKVSRPGPRWMPNSRQTFAERHSKKKKTLTKRNREASDASWRDTRLKKNILLRGTVGQCYHYYFRLKML
jgi:hypothetical protein